MPLIKRTFSGQPNYVLRTLCDIIAENGKNEFPIEAITENLRGTSKPIVFTEDDIEMLLDHKYGKEKPLTGLVDMFPANR